MSTQCDIVMYDKDTIPLIDNGIAHFYPVEIVKGIGEVKSTLNKVEFTKALVKLARNKLLYQERKGRLKSEERRFSENSEIFSFLVCNKLSFDITKIDFDEVYNEISDVKCRHNVVLSLQDGILTYTLNFSELPTKQKEHFINISVTMNVYTHIGFDDAEEELKRMEEFRKAQAEVEQKKEKTMSQKMFKVV